MAGTKKFFSASCNRLIFLVRSIKNSFWLKLKKREMFPFVHSKISGGMPNNSAIGADTKQDSGKQFIADSHLFYLKRDLLFRAGAGLSAMSIN